MIMLVIIITRSMIIMTIVNVMTLSLHILHGVRLLRFLSPRQDDMFFLNWDHTWVNDNGHLSVLCIVKRTISIIILVILTIILVSFYIDGHNKENHVVTVQLANNNQVISSIIRSVVIIIFYCTFI